MYHQLILWLDFGEHISWEYEKMKIGFEIMEKNEYEFAKSISVIQFSDRKTPHSVVQILRVSVELPKN